MYYVCYIKIFLKAYGCMNPGALAAAPDGFIYKASNLSILDETKTNYPDVVKVKYSY